MTLSDIRTRVYRRIGQSDNPDSEVIDRVTGFINYWHRRILVRPSARRLRQATLTLASVASTATYAAPQAFSKIRFISERDTDRRLIQQSLDWYRSLYPDPSSSTGVPDYWIPLGQGRVAAQPSNASEIFIKSTSASDTGTAYLDCIRTGGYRRSLSVTMTGTTAVSFSATTTDIIAIVNVHVSAAAVGTITVHEDSGTGTELARIPIGGAFPRYLLFALAPTPSAVRTYYIDGIVDIVDLSATSDEPLLPLDFHDILVDAAVYDEWRSNKALNREGKETNELRADLEGRIRELNAWLWEQPEGPYTEGVARALASQFDLIT